jgi:hypothetical protein
MSDLGSLLELIHDAHSGLTTLTADYRDWSRPRPDLYVERSALGGVRTKWGGAGPFLRAAARTRRIWLRAPDGLRVEILRERQLVGLGVLNAGRWWRWDSTSGAVSGELPRARPGSWRALPPLLRPPLVNPASLLAALRFEAIGSGVRIGRTVITARALPRPLTPAVRVFEYEFEFDAQHGTILRRAVLDQERVVSVTEATTVTYDGDVHAERFTFVSPDGQEVRHLYPGTVVPQAASEPGSPVGAPAARTRSTARLAAEPDRLGS